MTRLKSTYLRMANIRGTHLRAILVLASLLAMALGAGAGDSWPES